MERSRRTARSVLWPPEIYGPKHWMPPQVEPWGAYQPQAKYKRQHPLPAARTGDRLHEGNSRLANPKVLATTQNKMQPLARAKGIAEAEQLL